MLFILFLQFLKGIAEILFSVRYVRKGKVHYVMKPNVALSTLLCFGLVFVISLR